ncbi:hypothetical protein EIP91_009578 [Steccherinum ochraceum]|uniref:MYND-type domain-containing protein n=1 Tax=Steccherinum ochraceum TaxID=92696 RepID=A0A4R0RZT7_9APHY|nr:hypothetical protein EIP91_009578 [Steccherinum ochraceum]
MRLQHVFVPVPDVTGQRWPENMREYGALRMTCCLPHQEMENMAAHIPKFLAQLNARSGEQVLASAALGNTADCIEAGLRSWSGCTLPQDLARAMKWWSKLVIPSEMPPGLSVSRQVRARAFSCLAYAQWELRDFVSNGHTMTQFVDYFYTAAMMANEAASLGLVSSAVLQPGLVLHKQLKSGHFDVLEPPSLRFNALEFLWEAVEKQNKEAEKNEQKRDEKAANAPDQYFCAAEGCGIRATRKSGLLRCAGKCLSGVKPSYCSKDCQKADWKRHKPACTGQVPEPGPASSVDLAVVSSGVTEVRSAIRHDGREVSVTLPMSDPQGKAVEFSSTTLDPLILKEIRDRMEHMPSVEEREALLRTFVTQSDSLQRF